MTSAEWLNEELTFDQLDVPDVFEYECMTDDLGDDPADDEYIKAVAAGEYRHEMPSASCTEEKTEYVWRPDEATARRARLMGFAEIMHWEDDMDEIGYFKSVVQGKPGKAAVIKDIIGLEKEKADAR